MNQSWKTKSIIFWLITILWISIILYLSSQNGEETARMSSRLAKKLAEFLYHQPSAEQINTVHGAFRKMAHISLFFVLGVLSYVASRSTFRIKNLERKWMAAVMALTITSAYGFYDEWHKQFIVGRHFDIGETVLNICCGLAGVGIVMAVMDFKRSRSRRTID